MATFEDFLSEGKKIQIKRKYTENYPAQTVGKTANVRNAVIQAIKDGVVTKEEFNKILSELSTSSSQWASRNRKYFNVSEEGIKLSRWGRRILAELDETPKAAEVFEATVEMDAINPDDKDFLKFLKKNKVTIINKEMDGPGGGTPVITMQGKRKDLETVLADSELGWDDPDLAEYIEESVVNEKIKITKDEWPYIEFKDGGKKHKVEFDYEDIIDDHGNEGQDQYWIGKDEDGQEWSIDVYADYNGEVQDVFYDTIVKESVVFEAKGFKNTTDFEKFLEEIDGMPEAQIKKIMGKDYIDTPGFYQDEKDNYEDVIEFMISNMGNSEFEKLESWWENNVAESVVTEAKFVKDFNRDVLNAKTKEEVLELYPNAEFFIGKSDHFFGEFDENLFFKAYYTKGQKEFEIKSVYSEKGSNYVHLYNESVVTENYEVIYSDGISAMKKFRNEKQALDFMKKTIASNKKLRDIAVYKPGMYSTTQTELVVAFWGDGSYLDNVSKRDKDLAAKKLQENTNMKNEINLFESFSDFVGANFLNEKLGSQIMAQIFMSNRQGTHAKKNLSTLAKGFYNLSKVALDKVQDEDFIVSSDVSKVFKNYGGSSHILFFISDNEKENPYAPIDAYHTEKVVPGGGVLLAAMSGDKMFYTNHWSKWQKDVSWGKEKKGAADQIGINHKYKGWDATGLSNGKRIAEVADRVIVLNLELLRQKYSTENLRAARKEAKSGAIAFKSDKDFKAANTARYHKILADKAASLPLDKMVGDAIELLTKQLAAGLTSGKMTNYDEIKLGEDPKGREVKARDASNHMSNILDDYQRYVSYIKQGEESEARYGERESYYEREAKNYAKRVKDKIAKIDKLDYAW